MKMKKKLYGILAFVLVALCALGFAFGFAACSKEDDDNNTLVEDGVDPLIGTWEGNVDFVASLGFLPIDSSADTTIIVDEKNFSLSVKNVDIVGMKMFTDEDYVAIEDATWVNDGDGKYTATADITGSVIDIPIVVGKDNGTYYISLTADIELSIAGIGNITASFDDARVYKVSNETTKPWETEEESEEESEPMCECGEECTCGEDCECDGTCGCENCEDTGTPEEGCTCGDDCTCEENCECGEECTCEDCKQSGEE